MLSQKVFLSHSNKDKRDVRKLALDLRQNGIAVWLDEWQIRVGDSIIQKLQAGIKECRYLAIWLTHNSVNSGWVQHEWQTTFGQEIQTGRVTILPLLAEDCDIPIFLRDKKVADFRKDYTYGLNELLAVFRSPSTQVLHDTPNEVMALSLEYFDLDYDLSFYERKEITTEQYNKSKEHFETSGLEEELWDSVRSYRLEYEKQYEEKRRIETEVEKLVSKDRKISFDLVEALESIEKEIAQRYKKLEEVSKKRKMFLQKRFHRIYVPGTPVFEPRQNMGPAKGPVFLITVFNAKSRKVVLHTIELEVIKFHIRQDLTRFGLASGVTEAITPLAMYDISVPPDAGFYKIALKPQIGIAAGDVASLHVRLVPLIQVKDGDYYFTLNLRIHGSNSVVTETGPFHIALPNI